MPTVGEVRWYGSPDRARRRSTSSETTGAASMSSFHRAVVKKVAATGAPDPFRTSR